MSNPFDALKPSTPPRESEIHLDEWEGQFSCSTVGCNGYAKVAQHDPNTRVLRWVCQQGHESVLENME